MKTIIERIEETVSEYISETEKTEKEKKDLFFKKNPNTKYYPYSSNLVTKEVGIKELTKKVYRDIPERYRDAEISDESEYKKIANCFNQRKGIYFYGTAGTGKTYTMYAISKIIRVNSYYGGYTDFYNIPDLLGKFRGSFGKDGDGEETIEDYIEVNSILFLDDFGSEKTTEWNAEIMYRLINYRYEKMLLTFFASNLSLQELAEKSGDRIASRIAEMCEVINKNGVDRRLKK